MEIAGKKHFALLVALAGCGPQFGSSPSPVANNDVPSLAHRSAAGYRYEGATWMRPESSSGDLLYVSDLRAATVSIYTYPGDSSVGTLTDLSSPQGECIDKSGNVYVTETGAEQIVEYAHGGTSPIATLSDPYYQPVACAIDPATGDLAVTNILYHRDGIGGNVVIYRHAKGTPKYFSSANIYSYYFVGYDSKGDLFVDGLSGQAPYGTFEYAELARHHSKMKAIKLSGGSIAFPGNVQWDGEHIAIGDQDNAVIYQTTGRKIVGSTPLTGSSDVVGYFIDGGTVIAPDAGNASVEFYDYPAGGNPTGTITGFEEPDGAVVSP
jgi:hypothetical protein